MDEKVFHEWLCRLEESVTYYNIHKTPEWLEQIITSRSKLRELFEHQREKIEQYEDTLKEIHFQKGLMKYLDENDWAIPEDYFAMLAIDVLNKCK